MNPPTEKAEPKEGVLAWVTAILCCLVFLANCGQPHVRTVAEPLRVDVYTHGEVGSERVLPATSASVLELQNALSSAKWEPSLVAYAPSILFRGKNTEVIVVSASLVLESNDGDGRSTQWVSPLSADEYIKLQRLVSADLQTVQPNK